MSRRVPASIAPESLTSNVAPQISIVPGKLVQAPFVLLTILDAAPEPFKRSVPRLPKFPWEKVSTLFDPRNISEPFASSHGTLMHALTLVPTHSPFEVLPTPPAAAVQDNSPASIPSVVIV